MGKISDYQRIKQLRNLRKPNELVQHGGLIVQRKVMEAHKARWCGICGKEKNNPRVYYGEEFCGDCVEKSLHGK